MCTNRDTIEVADVCMCVYSVLGGWFIIVSNVFIYDQPPNPQYGGSVGG